MSEDSAVRVVGVQLLVYNGVGQEQNRTRPVLLPPLDRARTLMHDWIPSKRDLKRYPHFDKYLPPNEIERIVKNPSKIITNPFFPFLEYKKVWQPFRTAGQKPEKKPRRIRYASRRDAYIYAYYRFLLSCRYESVLVDLGISDVPIAYRRIASEQDPHRGKCNIHFAKDAFDLIEKLGDCCAISLDISSYFESIDHELLKRIWCRILDCKELPLDHERVFCEITRYAIVDRDSAYQRLGYFGTRTDGRRGFLFPRNRIPMQLCSPAEFREKICGNSPIYSSLIQVNKKPFGIPQGSPISDLLANMYLIDFDVEINRLAKSVGGFYYRYSDDILVIVPCSSPESEKLRDEIITRISKYGSEIRIKPEKTSLVEYKQNNNAQEYEFISGNQGKNGLEFLGFRYDGQRVYLRDSTLSSFYRKITYSARHEARRFVRRYPGKSFKFLLENFDKESFIKKYGRVEDFEENAEYRTWTFWTYANRSASVFGEKGNAIRHQLKGHRKNIIRIIERELERFSHKSNT